ncbi:hypothetical protein QYF36_002970 [Acer negundo]|nr:hypothetical protein QYF36_002970 [Acer negundo]
MCELEDLSASSDEKLDAFLETLVEKTKKIVDKKDQGVTLDAMAKIERDKALEIMKIKELEYIAKLVKAEEVIKSLTDESSESITQQVNTIPRRKRRNRRKRALLSNHIHQKGRTMWVRKDELRVIERGETVRLKKIGDEYVIDTSPSVDESSSSKELTTPKEPKGSHASCLDVK